MWQCLTKAASPQQDTVDDSEAASTSSSSASAYSWSRLSSYVYDKAADVAFDLAPIEQNLPLLRASAVLVELSHLVYVTRADDVQQTNHIDLPLLGSLRNRTTVACKLLHFRSAHNLCRYNMSLPMPRHRWCSNVAKTANAHNGCVGVMPHDVLHALLANPHYLMQSGCSASASTVSTAVRSLAGRRTGLGGRFQRDIQLGRRFCRHQCQAYSFDF